MARKRKAVASEAIIANCEERFRFRCPRQWAALAPTGDENVRYCGTCEKNVHFCRTGEELDRCAREGLCAAMDFGMAPVVGELQMIDDRSREPGNESSG